MNIKYTRSTTHCQSISPHLELPVRLASSGNIIDFSVTAATTRTTSRSSSIGRQPVIPNPELPKAPRSPVHCCQCGAIVGERIDPSDADCLPFRQPSKSFFADVEADRAFLIHQRRGLLYFAKDFPFLERLLAFLQPAVFDLSRISGRDRRITQGLSLRTG